MANFGKADRAGRSSGKLPANLAKLNGPPQGEAWAWLTRNLLTSAAWRSQSINCRRLIECLMIDHMNHAGLMNGELQATYNQLEKAGCTRALIRSAILEANSLGLIRQTFQHYRVASEFALHGCPLNTHQRQMTGNELPKIEPKKSSAAANMFDAGRKYDFQAIDYALNW